MVTGMPRAIPPFVQVQRRGDRVLFYFRKDHGRRTRLPDLDDPGFMEAYGACLVGLPAPRATSARRGTLRWLVEQWRQSSDWATTAEATRRQRDNILKHVLEKGGDAPFAEITAAEIRAGREAQMATPFAANNYLKTVRALFRWAKVNNHVNVDPAKDVEFIPTKTEGFTPWTEADAERYRKRWPLGTRPRLAFELLYHTGLRRGDVVRLGRQHIADGIATLVSEKTRVKQFIPIAPELAEAIEAGPTGDLALLATVGGAPMTKETFGNYFRGWCEAAVVKASAHGLRKLAATALAEAGGSEKELQALFGWKTNTQSALYTKAAEDRRLAVQAARKLNDRRPRLDTATPSPVEKIDKK
jgi:integrase